MNDSGSADEYLLRGSARADSARSCFIQKLAWYGTMLVLQVSYYHLIEN